MTADTFSKEGAEAIADRIARYWAKRGHAVATRVEKFSDPVGKRPIYFVRSDLVDGLPRAQWWGMRV